MLERIQFNLPKFYINEPLESDSLIKVLDSSFSVYQNLLLIKNGVKDRYDFAICDDERYDVVATVRVSYGLIGQAKRQAWVVKHFKPLLSIKPQYKVLCGVKDLKTNKFIYKYSHTSIKPEVIYSKVEECYTDLQILLNSF